MSELLYATTNKIKFKKAEKIFSEVEIDLKRGDFDFEEIQVADGKKIALHKARQAFDFFKKPVIVSDDVWSIPALNGFPGPYMKEVDNWFEAEDWLNLMRSKADKRIKLISYVVYKDEKKEKTFVHESERRFISKERKFFSKDGLLDIITLEGDKVVISELRKRGDFIEKGSDDFWRKIVRSL
jgi:XTP/dITP diphosphohydrolase